MSARSRYLEAISPRNENRDDDVISPTAATNNNHPSASNVNNVPSWQQNQQPNNSNINNNNAASIGLKRTSSVKSPSSITQQRTTGRTNNNNSGAVHAFLNHNSNSGNSGNMIVGNNAPPPPPPPGMPVKRKKNSSKTNLSVTTEDDKQLATKSNANAKSSKSNSTTSPVRAAGEQWSPREEIQSGNVQKYKNMIWGGNGGNSAAPPPSSTPDSPVASAVKTFEAHSPNRVAGGGGVTVGRGGSGKSPPRNSVAPSSSSSMSPSRPTPFYKRTAPPPIVTTPNRPTSTTKTAAITSTMPTPPSRVGVRQKRGVSPSPALPMSGGNVVGGGGINNKPATPLQQRRGNLNIAPLVTNFEGEMKQQKESDVVVRTQILHHQKQPQPHLPPSSSTNNAPLSLSSPSQQQQQQGITTITAFKRPNHKVGIIFTRQSSSSPDVAIIARILPESIFAQHDEAERRDQALRVAALKKQGGLTTTTTMSPLAVKAAATRGLEGSEVIAVNGVPVRNPRHAAEMVAKAVEEVRLTICKMVDTNNGGSGGMKKKGGVGVAAPGGGVVSPKTSPVFSPKVPELTDDDNSPQSRQEEEEGRPTNNQYHQLSNNLAQSRSIDEESTFSVRTEGPDQQQQVDNRKGMNSMADELSAVTETAADDEPLQKKKEPMFVVKRGSPKNQQNGRGGDDSAAAAAAAKKSKEIADMRRKVAQAMLMSQEMVHDPVDDGNNHDIDSEDEDWAAPQQVKKSPVFTKKKIIAPPPPPPPPQSPKSPSMDLAERRRQAALDMYNSQEMVGDNVDDAALGMTDVVGMNKETIGGGGGGGVLPPPMPMKDMDRVNSFGTSSVASKARTDITTESMATQQMGSTSPKVVASSLSGEKEVFQFEDDDDDENERKASIAVKSPVRESRRVEREPEEVAAAASAVAAGAMQELQRQRGTAAKKDNAAAVTRSAAAPPSPARDSVTDSPGRKGLFGKIKSQKKMFGGVKKMLKPQKFKKSKAVDRGIPLEDSHSNEESRVDTIETNTARRVVAAAVAPPPRAVPTPPATESQVTEPTEDLFAPPDESKSWGDDFFKDPFANSPFNDPAKGDPYGFPETERARNGDAFGFDNNDSWGEPQTLPDVKTADSTDSNGEMSEITDPSFISRKTDKKEANLGEVVADSKENYSTENKSAFGREQAEAMRANLFAKEQAAAMRMRLLNKQSSPKSSPTADPPISNMETYPSTEDEREDKNMSNLMAKSRIISKYGKNRRVARGTDSVGSLTPPRQIASKPPVAQSPMQSGGQQDAMNDLALAREQAIARQRAIDIAAAKAKQTGAISSYSSKSPRRNSNSSLSVSSSKSPSNYNSYPRQKKKASPSAIDNPAYYSVENYLVQVKDPIERAGVRLLWAAAIPIQNQARRFLARQHAIKRMCAVLTIQSFVRRWNAERNLEIAVWSAIQIQAVFRGWFARDSLEDNHYCATQIQRITRGYLATMHVFEDLYSITIVQSVVRRFLTINKAVDRLSSIIAIQAWYRGIRAREAAEDRFYSAIAIQSTWRRYMCQMTYQFDIIDIIIVQSIVRRRQALQLRKKTAAVVRIQTLARAIIARNKFVAKKSMHDLVTRHTSATKIQTCWRSYSAQVKMLMTIVNIIVIQSVWRRRAVEKLYKPHLHRLKLAKERKRYNAATKIQSAWRGFTDFSGYTIIRYENQAATIIQSQWRGYLHSTNYCIMLIEIVRIQALVRGRQERSWLTFQNECASIIQAAMRGYLTRRELHNESMISVLISAAATSLRTRNAARTLQRWWVEEQWRRKQKKAALIIERFFIYVKKEVEKEIKAMKKKKRQRKKMKKYMQSDDYLLENAWQGLEAAISVENPVAHQPAPAPTVPIPYDYGQQQQHHHQPQQQQQHQQYVDNRAVRRGMSPPRMGGVKPTSGGVPSKSGPPPQPVNYSAHAAANQSIPRNNSIRQQHGYRGRRYDRTDDDSLALDAAFAEASAHDSHLASSNQYQQRKSSKGYRGRRYN